MDFAYFVLKQHLFCTKNDARNDRQLLSALNVNEHGNAGALMCIITLYYMHYLQVRDEQLFTHVYVIASMTNT